MFKVDPSQNETSDGSTFGYVFVGNGGLFFTWRYDASASKRDQIEQVLDTLEPDSIDPPTGKWAYSGVKRAIRSHIRKYGMHPNTSRPR